MTGAPREADIGADIGADTGADPAARRPEADTGADPAARRIGWQDKARGLGILLVVWGHVERGLTAAGLASGPAWFWTDWALYTFHMPLFMVLAGLNVTRSLERGRGPFLRGKVLGILYPYVLWSILFGLAMVAAGGRANTAIRPDSLLFIGWAPIGPMWFLYVLFAFSLLAAVLPRPVLIGLAVVAFPLADAFGKDMVVHQLLHFLLFYTGGVVLAGRLDRMRAGWPAVLGGIAVVALATLAATGWPGGRWPVASYNAAVLLPVAAAGSLAVIALAKVPARATWLDRLGQWSMPIYIFHLFLAPALRIALGGRLVPVIGPVAYSLLATVLAVALSIAGYRVLVALNGAGWAGLAPGARGRRWIRGTDAPAYSGSR